MDILAAIIALGFGAVVLFGGFRLWLTLLPLIGFLVGFVTGTSFVSWLIGDAFLANILGIAVGVILAIGFALLSVLWWWAGVVVAVGGLGFAVGYGVLPAFGVDVGLVNVLLGLAVGAGFALTAIVLRLPRALVIVSTSLWGAGAVLAGVMLLLNIIDASDLGYGAVDQVLSESIFWTLAWVVLAIVGMGAQMTTTEEVSLVPADAGMGARAIDPRLPPTP